MFFARIRRLREQIRQYLSLWLRQRYRCSSQGATSALPVDAVIGRFAGAGAVIRSVEGGGMEIALTMVEEPDDDSALISLLTIGDIYLASYK